MSRPTSSAYLQWALIGGVPEVLIFDVVQSEKWAMGATVTEHPVEVGPNVADHVRVSLVEVQLSVVVSNEPVGRPQWGFGFQAPTLQPFGLSLPGANQSGVATTIFGTPQATGSITVPAWDAQLAERSAARDLSTLAGGIAAGTGGALAGLLAGAALAAEKFPPHATSSVVAAPPGLPVPVARGVVAQTYQFAGGNTTAIDFQFLTLNLLQALKDSAQLITVFGSKNTRANMVITQLEPDLDGDSTAMKVDLGLKEIRLVQSSSVIAPKPSIPRAATPTDKGPKDTKPPPPPIASKLTSMAGNLVTGQQYQDGFGFQFTQ